MDQFSGAGRILGTAQYFPGRKVTTDELKNRFTSERDLARLKLGGVETRYFSDPGTRISDVGTEVLKHALQNAEMNPRELKRIILVSSLGGDYVGTSTASAIIGNLGLNGQCDGFDLMNACTGFLSAADIACRSVATGMGPLAIVVVELLTRFMNPNDSRNMAITGDASSAIIIGPGKKGDGFSPIYLSNDFAEGPTIGAINPGLIQKFEYGKMYASLEKMTEMAFEGMRRGIKGALQIADLSFDKIDWFVPHQPSPLLLDLIIQKFEIDPKKVISISRETGTIAAASIPVCLDRLFRSDALQEGQTILMVSIGSPLVCGATVYRVQSLPQYQNREEK